VAALPCPSSSPADPVPAFRQSITGTTSSASPKNKKEEPAPELTPLEKLLQNAGPFREDGSDKFFGLENV
jgi:hypothetical protein